MELDLDSLPDAIVQYILAQLSSARHIAACKCVSKRWKDLTLYIESLYFPRNSFDNHSGGDAPDHIVLKMIASMARLKHLVVYCPFSSAGLASWLSHCGPSLQDLELRMDNIVQNVDCPENPLRTDCLRAAPNLESLKLWGVAMSQPPKWDVFERLRILEIIGARLDDLTLSHVLQLCPNLIHLSLLGCEGLMSISIQLPKLAQCKLDIYGVGNCSLSVVSPKLESLEVQGCSRIWVHEKHHLKNLSIANNAGRVYMVSFGKLESLEVLSVRGVQWCWDAISKMLLWSSEVRHLYMKVEFTGDDETLLPFPEVDFVEFFNGHQKLEKFDIHGAMFAALCQKNSLKNVDSNLVIPHLKEVTVTVRSPLNAEQKISTLESLVKYGKNLKRMAVKILQMKSNHSSADDFFEEVCRLRYMNRKIVCIE